ncbi:MAG: hypothetical protein ACRC3Z_12655 [Phocaeicola sp.]
MPIRIAGITLLFLASFISIRGQEKAVLYINGSPVSLSNLLYHYDKSPSASFDSFVDDFVDYQLQIRYALDLKLDTTTHFRNQVGFYSSKLASTYLNESSKATQFKRDALQNHLYKVASNKWVKVECLTYPLRQNASSGLLSDISRLMKQWRDSYKQGGSLSDFKNSCLIGEESPLLLQVFSWKPISVFLEEWIPTLNTLNLNVLSEPIVSPIGVHLIKLVGVSEEVPKEAFEQLAMIAHSQSGDCAASASPDFVAGLGADKTEFDRGVQEIYEALLVESLSGSIPHEEHQYDEADLQSYFEKHKEKYRWEFPHYKGVVVHCRDKRVYKKWRKLLKKLPSSRWGEVLHELTNLAPTAEIQYEVGLFQIGQNSFVDNLVFRCAASEPIEEYPFTFVLGKRLVKGPASYLDVRDELLHDLQGEASRSWLQSLHKKYKVEFDQEVLKTVNNSASN